MSEVYNKTVRGVGWSFADNIATQGVTFVVGLVLARLLTPEEYGLIGIITIFIALFNSIVDSGFSNALIRKKDAQDIDYSTVFITNFVISLLLYLILFVCAPAISSFFDRPPLTSLARVMGCIVVINALALVQKTQLVKRVDFKTQTKISLIASISSGVIGIAMALKGFGVWSLVGQQISRQLLTTLFLWFFNRWMPRLKFSINSFREMFNFGWKLMVSGLINTLWNELYQVVIGKCYSPATLGQYTRAQGFGTMFSSNLTSVVQRVSYPVLCSIQDDKKRLKQAYKKIIKVTMLVTFSCMLGLAAVAKPLVLVLIGDQWLPCVPFLQILCFNLMLTPLHAINLNILQVQGRSDLFLKLEIIKKCIAIIPIVLGIFINIYWMLCGSVVTGVFAYYLNAYYSGPFMNYSIKEQVKDILPSFGIAMCMCGCVYALSFLPISPFVSLPILIVVGISIVFGLNILFKLEEYQEVVFVATNSIKRFKAAHSIQQ